MLRRPERFGAIAGKRGGQSTAMVDAPAPPPAPFRLHRFRSLDARPVCPAPTIRRNCAARRLRSLPSPSRRRPAPAPFVLARCGQRPTRRAIGLHSFESFSDSSKKLSFPATPFRTDGSNRQSPLRPLERHLDESIIGSAGLRVCTVQDNRRPVHGKDARRDTPDGRQQRRCEGMMQERADRHRPLPLLGP